MNKNLNYWVQNYNLMGIIQGFNSQFMFRFNKPFYGKINFIICDRSNIKELEKLTDYKMLLSGYMPFGEKDEFMDEDFFLTVDTLYPIDKLIKELTPIKDKVFLIQISLNKNNKNDETVVSITKSW